MSDGTPDPRPRPRYGEYATPQEQAEIVAKSMPPVSPLLVPSDHAESVPVPSGAVSAGAVEADAAAPAPRRRWDLLLSVGLLVIGLWNVLATFAQFSDVSGLIGQVYESQGIGEFRPTAAAGTAGVVIIVSNVVLFAVVAGLTVRRLMAGRLAFWIPLAAGLVSFLITMVAIGVVMAGDPAFISYFNGMRDSPG